MRALTPWTVVRAQYETEKAGRPGFREVLANL